MSQPTTSYPTIFSVRIVALDHYMAPPIPDLDIFYSSFQGAKVKEVPVIRIFGSTTAGQKTCLHVHGVLPYLYVPLSEVASQNSEKGGAQLDFFCNSIEKTLTSSSSVAEKRQLVHGWDLVRAKRFYGYHESEELFLKIYLYYPNDIARVAAVLLGGDIQSKHIQPYESHIPFHLQFLVDYNLSGMGHLHTGKLKFRQPVPEKMVSGSVNYKNNTQNENSFFSQNHVADLNSEPLGSPALWLSSTVPSGWIWPSSCGGGDREHTQAPFVVRQSTCELEGDCSVDDILNSKSKLYTSFSQTSSEKRMVQSLLPIWEEEFARTGLQESFDLFESGRPPPESILEGYANGTEYVKILQMLCGEVESCSPGSSEEKYVQHLKESNDMGTSFDKYGRTAYFSQAALDLVNFPRGHNESPSTSGWPGATSVLPCEREIGGPLSSISRAGYFKVTDREALSVLNWLASSQALSELGSDDELGCEAILSPLLQANTYEKILEKAHVDYENASQKECQDILDSMTEVNLVATKEKTSCSSENEDVCASSDVTIPQVDGSSDDLNEGSSLNIFSGKSKSHEPERFARMPASLHTRKKLAWCNLPFSNNQELEAAEASSLNSLEITCSNETKGDGVSSCPSCEGMHRLNDEAQISGFKLAQPARSSLRELMRRKRGPADLQENKVSLEAGKMNDLVDDNGHSVKPFEVSYVEHLYRSEHVVETGKSPTASPPFIETDGCYDFNSKFCNPFSLKEHMSRAQEDKQSEKFSDFWIGIQSPSHAIELEKLRGTVQDKQLLPEHSQELKCGISETSRNPSRIICKPDNDDSQRKNTVLSMGHMDRKACVNFPETTNYLAGSEGIRHSCFPSYTEMGFFRKPPTSDHLNKISDNFPVVTFNAGENIAHRMPENVIQRSRRQYLQGFQPFFPKRFEAAEGCSNLDHDEDVPNHRQVLAMGVPSHFQNDGSVLYMLTYAVPPPSFHSVYQWLSDTSQKGFRHEGDSENYLRVLQQHQNILENKLDGRGTEVLEGDSTNEVPFHCRDKKQYSNQVGSHADRAVDVLCSAQIPSAEPKYVASSKKMKVNRCNDLSQISGPEQGSKLTPLSQLGFHDPASEGGGQQLTLLSMEVQTEARDELRPDPHFDAVNIVTIVVQEDSNPESEVYVLLRDKGVHQSCDYRNFDGISGCKFVICSEERCLFQHLMRIIRITDPDMLIGWEIQGSSLGYLGERAAQLGLSFLKSISRTYLLDKSFEQRETPVTEGHKSIHTEDYSLEQAIPEVFPVNDEWGRTHASGIHVGGRIVLNLWRLLQSEVKLNFYTIEAVAEEVLRRKVPSIPYRVLSRWFSDGSIRARFRCIENSIAKTKLNLAIVNKLDMINRTSELARVFGIDFFSVLSRGSQFRVESMMLRLAHSQNYLAISPGHQQVAFQPAMECLPLVMEPISGFYADPVVVLDFQSLYPSMIIAYNLCFCTCLGKTLPSKENVLGVSSYSTDRKLLKQLKNQILLSPNGVMYVSSKVRKGIVPRLLEEILSTRIMLKKSMKKLKSSQQVLQRIYNARQLALKLIANVTYGYTAAGFSGRMPCAELADSIVQCGRSTLESAISFVNAEKKWNATVLYGDTDSMFVLLKGRSLEEAFKIGNEIALEITAMNPSPVTLKLEKVYSPCFLLTKKRYVGYSFESSTQHAPKFDAKGIETVRRDTCRAVSKILEQSLKIYFEHQSIFQVKSYVQRQWARILSGRVSLQDFIFAKEVRLGTYATNGTLPPAAIVAIKAMQADPRAEPMYAERIPYVVIHGEPGSRLVDMVVDPLDVLEVNSPYRLNDVYYIFKQIMPALQRVFGLVGADLDRWFSEIPRPSRITLARCQSYETVFGPDGNNQCKSKGKAKRSRIDSFYLSKHCIVCGHFIQSSVYLCDRCSNKEPIVAAVIIGKASKLEREIQHLAAICTHCGGADWIIESGVKCNSLACSVFYERKKVQKELQAISAIATDTGFYPRCSVEWF